MAMPHSPKPTSISLSQMNGDGAEGGSEAAANGASLHLAHICCIFPLFSASDFVYNGRRFAHRAVGGRTRHSGRMRRAAAGTAASDDKHEAVARVFRSRRGGAAHSGPVPVSPRCCPVSWH